MPAAIVEEIETNEPILKPAPAPVHLVKTPTYLIKLPPYPKQIMYFRRDRIEVNHVRTTDNVAIVIKSKLR